MRKVPLFIQHDIMDCGPASLMMIAAFYGKKYSLQTLRKKSALTREGVSLLGISDAAESIGFRSYGVKITFRQLMKEAPLPCIAYWKQEHFIVIYKVTRKFVYVADPASGYIKYHPDEFLKNWKYSGEGEDARGICLLLEPSPDFYATPDEKPDKTKFSILWHYFKPYKKYITQLIIGLILGSLIQLIFPFLTQAVVDIGINNQNLAFITIILIAQFCLMISRMAVNFIRSWILLHISSRVNISLISDFLIKLMKLPASFFDTKMTGDILQRISDHRRIESFITVNSLSILFTLINLVIFGIVLLIYSPLIFGVFLLGSALYIGWILLFLGRRRQLDYMRFNQHSKNQSVLIQLIYGMQEIKLNNYEKEKRWEWENLQAQMFRLNIKTLALNQYQAAGATTIDEIKNIIISFLAAWLVVKGQMTLGMMLAVQFIIGQLSSPLTQAIVFLNHMQDARLSLERLAEIHVMEDETSHLDEKINELPREKTLSIENVSFRYDDPYSNFVLDKINMKIQPGKITAIVGASGSGKTTLVKLLLGFYQPEKGEIKVGNINLKHLNPAVWRKYCGAVLQDGFIFSDTILRNIVLGDEYVDFDRFYYAIEVANLTEMINDLPLNYNTKVGTEGHGLSQGQKQRILIARTVYKNPQFIFLDEATNALDARNEKTILSNLQEFFKDKSVVIVAHRLSTVKNADQIIVLDKGKMVEMGTHEELIRKKGNYFHLVKNQLELGN